MKTRQGFVSNSSSTSFTICGVAMNQERIKEILGVDDPFSLDGQHGLQVWSDPNDWAGTYYIGMILSGTNEYCEMRSAMRDDETKEQFRQRVEGVLREVTGGHELVCGFHSAGWYDG
jgi:hypothetical protein